MEIAGSYSDFRKWTFKVLCYLVFLADWKFKISMLLELFIKINEKLSIFLIS